MTAVVHSTRGRDPLFFSRMQSNMRTRGDRADKAVIVDRAA